MSSTRERVLRALLDAHGDPVSGEAIARELRISRVAVGKHIAALRKQGFEIEAMPARGYALDSRHVLLPAAVAASLRDPDRVELYGGGTVGSTQDEARKLANAGAPAGTSVVASAQTSGRGRLGRSWVSPPGGVYVSILLRPRIAPSEAVSLPLVVSLGVARGVETLGAAARLKWPNDVLLQGDKLAGVLLEMHAESDMVEWVSAGIGLNVFRGAPGRTAAYLADDIEDLTLSRVAAAVIDGVLDAVDEFNEGGFAALTGAYSERLTGVDRAITVTDSEGTLLARGMALGVDEHGRLRVQTDDGERAFATGDVSLRAPCH